MTDRRKNPRYPLRLRAYFPREKVSGYTENISLDGCFVEASAPVSEGLVKDFYLEIPILGIIALKGYVQHAHDEVHGVGMQLVKVRFATDQEWYYGLYTRFLEILAELDKLHDEYLDMALRGKAKLCTFPQDAFPEGSGLTS